MSESGVTFHAHGMHCHGCEHIIETSVRKLPGVRTVKADYPAETVTVAFDPAATNLDEIRATIEQAGYRTYELDDPKRRRSTVAKLAGLILGVAGILLIIFFDTEWISQGGEPDITQHMSLGLIFLLGLLTGFHCVGMCGGFVLSYTADDAAAGRRSYLSHLLYGAGKTLSYTLIGATFGLLGAFVAFTPLLRGVAGMLAGAFLIVFGLNMLGLFAPLRRFRLGLPAPLQTFIYEKQTRSRHRPFVIGLLNGSDARLWSPTSDVCHGRGHGQRPRGGENAVRLRRRHIAGLIEFRRLGDADLRGVDPSTAESVWRDRCRPRRRDDQSRPDPDGLRLRPSFRHRLGVENELALSRPSFEAQSPPPAPARQGGRQPRRDYKRGLRRRRKRSPRRGLARRFKP